MVPASWALGAVLMETERAPEAETILAEGLRETGDAYLAAGLAHNLAHAQLYQGKKEKALKSFEEVQRLDPGRGDLDLTRAHLLEDLSRFDEALAAMRKVLAHAPDNVAMHNDYNDLLYRTGQEEDFLKSYDRAPKNAALGP